MSSSSYNQRKSLYLAQDTTSINQHGVCVYIYIYICLSIYYLSYMCGTPLSCQVVHPQMYPTILYHCPRLIHTYHSYS